MKYADFKFGTEQLKFFDKSKVKVNSFTPAGQNRTIRFFRKITSSDFSPEAKIISRSGFSSFREPFEIEPWNQILIDDSHVYGNLIDDNKEDALRGIKKGSDVIRETRLSVAKMFQEGFVWVARGEMICHPDSLIYGEVDEIWYHAATETFYIGDTKTASSVDKMTYWYQLGIYIEIMKSLNPGIKISTTGIIDWVKIKTEKRTINKDFNELEWQDSLGKQAKPSDPVYNARWNKPIPIEEELTNKIIPKDLIEFKVLEQVRNDIKLIKDFDIKSVDDFNKKLESNYNGIVDINNQLQKSYDEIKKTISKWG